MTDIAAITGRTWCRASVDLPEDPKAIDAGPMAELALLRLTLTSARLETDGVLSLGQAARSLGDLGDTDGLLDTLHGLGLVHLDQDARTVEVLSFCTWQETKAENEARREGARIRMTKSLDAKAAASGPAPVARKGRQTGATTKSRATDRTPMISTSEKPLTGPASPDATPQRRALPAPA